MYWFCHTLTWICHGYTCVPHPDPLPPPSPSHPSGSSQRTSPEHPVSCIEPGLEIRFTYDNLHVSMSCQFKVLHKTKKGVVPRIESVLTPSSPEWWAEPYTFRLLNEKTLHTPVVQSQPQKVLLGLPIHLMHCTQNPGRWHQHSPELHTSHEVLLSVDSCHREHMGNEGTVPISWESTIHNTNNCGQSFPSYTEYSI